MTRPRLASEADAVAWIERTKGGARAADILDAMLAELRRLWALEDAVNLERRRFELRTAMRQDVTDVRKLMRGESV